MEEFEYIFWQDYYKDKFYLYYNKVKKLVSELPDSGLPENADNIIKDFMRLYSAACASVRFYLGNNGIFYDKYIAVIKGAFRLDILEDGDNWVILNSVVNSYNAKKCTKEALINFALRKNFKLFEDLYNKFERILAENG